MIRRYTVGKSRIHGKGLFAAVNIKKGEIVCALPHSVVHRHIRSEKESMRFVNWIEIGKNAWVNPNRSALRHFNHSCDPNTIITKRRTVVAIKPIKVGDEITFDYSLTDTDSMWHVDCMCAVPQCRKTIGSIHTLPRKVYKARLHFIPRHARIAFNSV